jgi:hypothetical protein
MLSFPVARKASRPAPSCQSQVTLALWGGSAARFDGSAGAAHSASRLTLPRLPNARLLSVSVP